MKPNLSSHSSGTPGTFQPTIRYDRALAKQRGGAGTRFPSGICSVPVNDSKDIGTPFWGGGVCPTVTTCVEIVEVHTHPCDAYILGWQFPGFLFFFGCWTDRQTDRHCCSLLYTSMIDVVATGTCSRIHRSSTSVLTVFVLFSFFTFALRQLLFSPKLKIRAAGGKTWESLFPVLSIPVHVQQLYTYIGCPDLRYVYQDKSIRDLRAVRSECPA